MRPMVWVLLIFLFLFTMTHTVSLSAQGLDILKKGVVKITARSEGKRKVGTGFIVQISQDVVYIVTASHVVEGDKKPEVEFFTQRNLPVSATVVELEGGDPRGFALLLVRGKEKLLSGLSALNLAPSIRVGGGDEVIVIGFPRMAGPWAVIKGSIVSRKGREIIFQGDIDEGNSGGPMAKDNLVVGLVTGLAGRFGRANPAASLRSFLEGCGVKLEEKLEVVAPDVVSTLKPGKQKSFTNSIGMKFVLIRPGTFMMGSPPDDPSRDNDERQHRVTLSKGLYLQTTEVTQGQWYAVMGSRPWSGKDFVRDNTDCPAVYISWNECRDFIRRLNRKGGTNKYRLPTEAEWEYACRAGSTTTFHFGKSDSILGDYAWYRNNAWDVGEKYAHTVGSKKANAWGLYDMHGNAWEWCQDWYEKNYPSEQVPDPKGPSSGEYRVLRGGGWYYDAGFCRSANRGRYYPDRRYYYYGFRVARDL